MSPASPRLPESIIPILESVVLRPTVASGLPLEFWRHGDHRAWIDAFMEFGSALAASDVDDAALPRGYGLIAELFDWEGQCQFSGWYAFANRQQNIDRIIEAYRFVGLPGEADALMRANNAWNESGGDHATASAAYSRVSPEFRVDLDRLEFLAAYFVEHANELLYVGDN
jgi:hypothetical protein